MFSNPHTTGGERHVIRGEYIDPELISEHTAEQAAQAAETNANIAAIDEQRLRRQEGGRRCQRNRVSGNTVPLPCRSTCGRLTAQPRSVFDTEYYVEGYASTFNDPYVLFEDFDGTKYIEVISPMPSAKRT